MLNPGQSVSEMGEMKVTRRKQDQREEARVATKCKHDGGDNNNCFNQGHFCSYIKDISK